MNKHFNRILHSDNCQAEAAVPQLSGFNTVLNRVLVLTETTTEECARLKLGTVERWQCEGKLMALEQVIEYFLEADRREFGATSSE
jgi:hypothetical protein